jgi:hypothetical protein
VEDGTQRDLAVCVLAAVRLGEPAWAAGSVH